MFARGDPDGIRGLKTDFELGMEEASRAVRANRRYLSPTSRKGDDELLSALRQGTGGLSLRKLATFHGVSHETIRRALLKIGQRR